MEDYIKDITPLVQNILELTKSRAMQWERTGDGTYRCVAEYVGVSLEISRFYNVIVKDSVSIRLYNDSECIFSYSRQIVDSFKEFDKLLQDLFAEVELANREKVKNKLSDLVNAFTKNMK